MKRRFPLPQRARRGMALLEVMIALTVFTLVAFSLVKALYTTMNVAIERNAIGAATRGLEGQVALLHASMLTPCDKDLPDDGSGISYHLVVEQEQMKDQKDAPVSGMYRATLTAKWIAGRQEDSRSVSELIYQP